MGKTTEGTADVTVKGVTLNNILTFLTALGLGGGGFAAYKNWPEPTPIVEAVDTTVRNAVESLKSDTASNRAKTWDAINALRESQSRTDTQLQVLTTNVNNLADNVQDYIVSDRAEAAKAEAKDEKHDDRLRDLEIRRTP